VAEKSRTSSLRQRVARGSNAAGSDSDAALAVPLSKALGALANDLTNPSSESDDYFHPFVGLLPSSTKLDAQTFKQALKVGASYHIDLSSADDFFSSATDEENNGEDAPVFRQLETVMRATLSKISLAFARREGLVRVRMWLFGRTKDGTLVGLRSETTET